MERITYLINDYLYSISGASGVSVGLIGIGAGLLLIILGYKLKKVALISVGFLAGYTGGSYLSHLFLDPGTVMFIITPIALGLVAAVLMFAVYYLSLYMMGLLMGVVVGFYLGAHLFGRPLYSLIAALVVGIVVGSVGIVIEKPIVIFGTVFIGYIAFRQGVYALFDLRESVVLEIVCLSIALLGIVVQFLLNRGKGGGEKGSEKKIKGEETPAKAEQNSSQGTVNKSAESFTDDSFQDNSFGDDSFGVDSLDDDPFADFE